MSEMLRRLARDLHEAARVATSVAETVPLGERRQWDDEAQYYTDAACVTIAAATQRDGASRVTAVAEVASLIHPNHLGRDVWLRVGAMVRLRTAVARPRGVRGPPPE